MLRFRIHFILLLIFISHILYGCKESKTNTEYAKEIKDIAKSMIGRSISFPDSLLQELQEPKKSVLNKRNRPKIISVIAGNCETCIKDFKKWEPYLKEMELMGYNNNLFFIVEDVDISFFKKYYGERPPTELTLYFDKNQTFSKLNNLPHIKILKTFMIDTNNEIILVGNPVHDRNLWNLYLEGLRIE
ncbi:MAG: hypothetical protein GX102_00970 [Porphyromonadaceae bacterium]|jgi:hypothetical protein|nr:hypothetical protein [Porphyromonadaceae bacterium]